MAKERPNILVIRVGGGVVFALCTALLLRAGSLEASDEGVGTHTQMGMTKCSYLEEKGHPCPTCGMTTSFALAANGRVLASFANQPAGGFLALLAAMGAVIGAWVMLTGCPAVLQLRRLLRPATFVTLILFFLAAWQYKVHLG